MAERNLLREAAQASLAAARRSLPARPVADAAEACGGALSVGLAPVVACLARAVLERVAREAPAARPGAAVDPAERP